LSNIDLIWEADYCVIRMGWPKVEDQKSKTFGFAFLHLSPFAQASLAKGLKCKKASKIC
jgi:hypothetical protein